MIIDFTISNFRSIREAQTLSFEATKDTHLDDYYVIEVGKYRLLKIATILGANASGKSNILSALDLFPRLLLAPCETKSSLIKYDKFALSSEWQKRDTEMEVNFICGAQKYHYEVKFNHQMVVSEVLQCQPFDKLRPHTVYERVTDIKSLLSTVKWGAKYASSSNARDLNVNLLHNRTVFGAYQKSNVDMPWMKNILDWIGDYMMPIIKTSEQNLFEYTSKYIQTYQEHKNQIVSLLQKADVGVRDLVVENQGNSIKIKMLHDGADGGAYLDFQEESNGTKRFYELSSFLLRLTLESHFVAIDELECRLHPDLYRHFIITFLTNAKHSQLVFTTHLREFLADDDLCRKDAVWFAEKNEEGATELFSLDDFEQKDLKKVPDYYVAYRSGLLGAIPHLGDTFIDN